MIRWTVVEVTPIGSCPIFPRCNSKRGNVVGIDTGYRDFEKKEKKKNLIRFLVRATFGDTLPK